MRYIIPFEYTRYFIIDDHVFARIKIYFVAAHSKPNGRHSIEGQSYKDARSA
jgi:hypothetical protein